MGLLRCVEAREARRLVEEIHAGTCGPHMNGFTLEKKIMRSGYYCLTMETDCIRNVQKCRECQTHVDMIRVPLPPTNSMSLVHLGCSQHGAWISLVL